MKINRLFALFVALLLALGAAGLRAQTASAEPSVHDIYQAAENGDMQGARRMIDEVIAKHPNSGKAHYVKAELAAHDHDAATARTELQTADRLAPGLPFAKPAAVSALRSQIDQLASARVPTERRAETRGMGAPPSNGLHLAWLVIAALVVIGLFLLMRRRPAVAYPAGPNPYTRDDAFGRPGYPPQPMGPGGYPQGYPPGAYPGGYPQQPGMGSTIARGLGTGLAVGAGMVAAEEIGHRLFDHGGNPVQGGGWDNNNYGQANDSQIARDAGLGSFDPGVNQDMGGQDFGIADNGGWDNGGGFDDVGGGGDDWNQ